MIVVPVKLCKYTYKNYYIITMSMIIFCCLFKMNINFSLQVVTDSILFVKTKQKKKNNDSNK